MFSGVQDHVRFIVVCNVFESKCSHLVFSVIYELTREIMVAYSSDRMKYLTIIWFGQLGPQAGLQYPIQMTEWNICKHTIQVPKLIATANVIAEATVRVSSTRISPSPG